MFGGFQDEEEEPRLVGSRSRRVEIRGDDFVVEGCTCPAEEKGVRSSGQSRVLVCVFVRSINYEVRDSCNVSGSQ